MLRYSFLCMIISYVRLCALSCILPLPSGAYLVCLAWLSESSALSKMGRLQGLTFTPVIVMTFEFCQRGATVDTPFLTVLKTWTSPFEHSVIIHVCVRLEFPEVLVARLASGSLDLTVPCLVLTPHTCDLPWSEKSGLLDPLTFHRPSPSIIGFLGVPPAMVSQNQWPVGIVYCRSALYFAGDIFCWPVWLLCTLEAWCMPAVPAGMHHHSSPCDFWLVWAFEPLGSF